MSGAKQLMPGKKKGQTQQMITWFAKPNAEKTYCATRPPGIIQCSMKDEQQQLMNAEVLVDGADIIE